jgi:hypothetical protein
LMQCYCNSWEMLTCITPFWVSFDCNNPKSRCDEPWWRMSEGNFGLWLSLRESLQFLGRLAQCYYPTV